MTAPLPHPNMGSSGTLRSVIQLLDENPAGLSAPELLELATTRGSLSVDPFDGPKTAYLRIKRAVESLLKLGFVCHAGSRVVNGRLRKAYALVPQAMDEALRNVLRQAFGNIEDQIRNQFPVSDTAHLLAAFGQILEEDAERLGLETTKPSVGNNGLAIRKRTDP